ncbi:putative BNR repeat neuraminidase [Saccharothrix saharensis]|uniref:Putative BNR repeat neuraminidase n=1 Tax=Saccharothrix saharensis TaxID=571190 RepID=A0A543JQ85_9PSEU|nr:BNR repeat-containing protein [Saccharothrix saharensis]TQM85002.1 putative BNR repeat neuraminidase [Saccharothrix saharensis]
MVSETGPNGPSATLVSDTLLDPAALFFVSYDGVVNNNSFQRDAILTHAGHQYATWYTSSRHAVVARRPLGGEWEHVVLPHRLRVDDSHNVISLGICPRDGTLHVAMDTHDNRVFYVKSVVGLATSPLPWDAAAFGPVRRTVDGVELGEVTYPQFVVTPGGDLQLSYRTGCSGNGVNELAEYRDGVWTRLGAWSSAVGDYTGPNGVVSTTRNMYLHGLDYDRTGRLHAAFTWREGDSGVLWAPGGLANHDTGYVHSDDRGRTWRTSAGTVVATTGGTPVGVSSPGILVDHLGPDHALMNQESQGVDSTGTPHVVISYVPERLVPRVSDYSPQRTDHARTFHLTRVAGTWTKREVPVAPNSTQRTKLAFDRFDNLYLVMPRGLIVAASRASGWTDWTTVFTPTSLRAFGEVNVDTSRIPVDGVLSVQYQRTSTGTTPSPIRVADFRLGP